MDTICRVHGPHAAPLAGGTESGSSRSTSPQTPLAATSPEWRPVRSAAVNGRQGAYAMAPVRPPHVYTPPSTSSSVAAGLATPAVRTHHTLVCGDSDASDDALLLVNQQPSPAISSASSRDCNKSGIDDLVQRVQAVLKVSLNTLSNSLRSMSNSLSLF